MFYVLDQLARNNQKVEALPVFLAVIYATVDNGQIFLNDIGTSS